MFNLKYTLTAADLKAENKKLALFYFALYFTVAVIGLAVGIAAVVVNPQVTILVMGIIILVFAALLLAVSLLLLIAPKNLVVGAVEEGEMEVTVDKHGITVNGQSLAPFADVTKIKNRKTYLVVYLGKDKVFILKDAVTSGQTLNELCSYMTERQGKLLLEVPAPEAEQNEQETATVGEQPQGEKNDENTGDKD